MDREQGGRFFREAWITGVHKHYPGTPKPGYIAPWEEMPDWEKEIVTELYQQMQALVLAGTGSTPVTRLTKEQGGRVIRIGWIGQVYKHIPNPKPAYVCDWEEMSSWEQEVDMDIFEAIEEAVLLPGVRWPGQSERK
jgi:hypothetical protein